MTPTNSPVSSNDKRAHWTRWLLLPVDLAIMVVEIAFWFLAAVVGMAAAVLATVVMIPVLAFRAWWRRLPFRARSMFDFLMVARATLMNFPQLVHSLGGLAGFARPRPQQPDPSWIDGPDDDPDVGPDIQLDPTIIPFKRNQP